MTHSPNLSIIYTCLSIKQDISKYSHQAIYTTQFIQIISFFEQFIMFKDLL